MLNFTLKGLKKVDYDIEKNCLLFVFENGVVQRVSGVVKGGDLIERKQIFGVKRG